jgi:hypothetical protein
MHVTQADLIVFRADFEKWVAGQFDWWRDRMTHALAEITRLDESVSSLKNQVIQLTAPVNDLHSLVGQILSEINIQNSAIQGWSDAWDAYKQAQSDHDTAIANGGDAAAAKEALAAAEADLSGVAEALSGANGRINNLANDVTTSIAAIAPPSGVATVPGTLPTQEGDPGQTQVQSPVGAGGQLTDSSTGQPIMVNPGASGTPSGSGNDTIGSNAGGVPVAGAPAQIGGLAQSPFAPDPAGDGSSTDGSTTSTDGGATSSSTDTSSSSSTSSASSPTSSSTDTSGSSSSSSGQSGSSSSSS